MSGPKETVYDADISPLMQEIIAICDREGIPIIASFQLDEDEEQGFMTCDTLTGVPIEEMPPSFVRANKEIRSGGHQCASFAIMTKDAPCESEA